MGSVVGEPAIGESLGEVGTRPEAVIARVRIGVHFRLEAVVVRCAQLD